MNKEDISCLNITDIDSIISQLSTRYDNNQPFTFVGSDALIAIYKESCYSDFDYSRFAEIAEKRWTSPEMAELQSQAHPLDMASSAFYHLINAHEDQSIIIRGDSGSGKSQIRRAIVQQLVSLSKNSKKSSKVLNGAIKLETVLKSFGHATVNDSLNSSRYGLYSEYQYSSSGRMVGVKTLDYLLDKNRITASFDLPEGERNFNIFYQLIAGTTNEEKDKLFLASETGYYSYLQGAKQFGTLGRKKSIRGTLGRSKSLSRSNNVSKQNSTVPADTSEFALLREHLKSLGIGKTIQSFIFSILAAILHIGNLQFAEDSMKVNEPCHIKNKDSLSNASALLGVSEINLETTFSCQSKLIGKDLVSIILTVNEAEKRRDGLARALYSLLFSWLLNRINERLCKDEDSVSNFISLIDFSSLQTNQASALSFYEFSLNIAYERISQFCDAKFITSRDSILRGESVSPPSLTFADHFPVLQFLSGPAGLIGCLNEEITANQNAESISSTLAIQFSKNEFFIPSSRCIHNSTCEFIFGIRHNFSKVEYNLEDFQTRNTEMIASDYVALFRDGNQSDGTNDKIMNVEALLASLFSVKTGIEMETKGGNIISARVNATLKRNPSVKKKGNSNVSAKSIQPQNTALSNLVESLDNLMVSVSTTKVYSIICINPSDGNSKRISSILLRQQLEKLSIPSLAISRSFANVSIPGMSFDAFEEQYESIISKYQNTSQGTQIALNKLASISSWSNRDIIIGRTQIFLSDGKWRWLKSHSTFQDDQSYYSNSIPRSQNGRNSQAPESVAGTDDDYVTDNESEYNVDVSSSPARNNITGKGDVELGAKSPKGVVPAPRRHEIIESVTKLSSSRKSWVCCTWCLTWWIPSFVLSLCCKMKRPDIRMAWREKVALCILIFLLCASLLFLIVGLGYIICPPLKVRSLSEIRDMRSQPWVSAHGRYYNIQPLVNSHLISLKGLESYTIETLYGQDVSKLFFKTDSFSDYCPGIPAPPTNWDYLDPEIDWQSRVGVTRFNPSFLHRANGTDGRPVKFLNGIKKYVRGNVGYTRETIKNIASSNRVYVILFNNVYYVKTMVSNTVSFKASLQTLLNSNFGNDVTAQWKAARDRDPEYFDNAFRCMNELFFVGIVDNRDTFQCRFSNYILLAASVILVAVIGVKFIAALQCSSMRIPDENDKFCLLMVPCYTEGHESCLRTLESLAVMDYDDKRKLLFIVCDGNIVGAGNELSTPRIVLDILGVDRNIDPEPLAFQSLGEGNKQYNMAKIYSGLYEVRGHSVPFIVVVKVGGPGERVKPGNRGKRDSQLVLMKFFNRVHFNLPLSPMELELYHQMKNIIGVSPTFYEFVLMVDADTQVEDYSLSRFVASMVNDGKIMGICGETLLSNEKTSWVTFIQVYEYFISHYLSKAFESLFGTVTCLPGCFCMYRLRSSIKNTPLLVSKQVLEDYSENRVDTLHTKNLLHLGEDRYLTTLMLKHFPEMRTSFTSEAQCKTMAPDDWPVLLSQRRRWINSTVHNLLELISLKNLCGFCCFSMRFVVMIDLFATFVQPAAVLYIIYLIYAGVAGVENFPILSLILIAAIYGLQVIIFIIRRQWQHIVWMIIYILATPVFAFYIPLYSFWHFDDFSWGNTRVVVGEGKKTILIADVEPFDPDSIPLTLWKDYEESTADKWEKESTVSEKTFKSNRPVSVSDASQVRPVSMFAMGGNTNSDKRMSMTSNVSVVHSRAGYAQGSPSATPVMTRTSNAAQALPSDEQLLSEIRGILADADLMTLTKKQVREELSKRFGGIDLKGKREIINRMIDSILKGM